MLGRMLRERSIATLKAAKRLLQLRVLRLGFLQDGDVGVGIFPEREEVLIGSAALGSFARERIGTGEAEMGERAQRKVDDNATVVEDLLKLGNSGSSVVCH